MSLFNLSNESLGIITFSRLTLSRMTLNIATLGMTMIGIVTHNDIFSNVTMNITLY